MQKERDGMRVPLFFRLEYSGLFVNSFCMAEFQKEKHFPSENLAEKGIGKA